MALMVVKSSELKLLFIRGLMRYVFSLALEDGLAMRIRCNSFDTWYVADKEGGGRNRGGRSAESRVPNEPRLDFPLKYLFLLDVDQL